MKLHDCEAIEIESVKVVSIGLESVKNSVSNVILDMPKLTGSCLSDTGIG